MLKAFQVGHYCNLHLTPSETDLADFLSNEVTDRQNEWAELADKEQVCFIDASYNKKLFVFLLFSQHRALMEELSRSKKDFEEKIQAKNKELEETKVLNRESDFCLVC